MTWRSSSSWTIPPAFPLEARAAARRFVEDSVRNRRAHDTVGVLGFAQTAAVWQAPATSSQLAAHWPETPDAARAGTDIGHALEFAAAVLPPGAARRIVLLSDGNDTAAAGSATAARLSAAGIEIDTVPLRNPAKPEVLVAAVNVPGGLKSGEPFDLRADVQSNVATTAKVNLYQNQFLAGSEDLAVKPGSNEVTLCLTCAPPTVSPVTRSKSCPLPTPGPRTTAPGRRSRSADSRACCSWQATRKRAAPLAGALREAKIDVETRGPAGLPRSLSELQRFDLFALSDVSALQMTHDQMELYRTWVQQFGGGFIMIGGENSFGVGGYFRTPIENDAARPHRPRRPPGNADRRHVRRARFVRLDDRPGRRHDQDRPRRPGRGLGHERAATARTSSG